jgi:hypothetical protein
MKGGDKLASCLKQAFASWSQVDEMECRMRVVLFAKTEKLNGE